MTADQKDKFIIPSEVNSGLHLHVTFFTDPLCCWSWGMQPHLEALQSVYGEHLTLQYVMGGMLPSWERFHDEVNAVSRPVQMGPVWMHAAQLTGRQINHLLWIKDPPASSYPACIAVKCAHLQSADLGIKYFHRVQEACMGNGKNIAEWRVLEAVAQNLAQENDIFDLKQFMVDYQHETGADAFRADLDLAGRYRITRFPTLLIECENNKPVIVSGFRTTDGITSVVKQAFGL